MIIKIEYQFDLSKDDGDGYREHLAALKNYSKLKTTIREYDDKLRNRLKYEELNHSTQHALQWARDQLWEYLKQESLTLDDDEL